MTASSLLRLYPRAWRKRYGGEFLALLGSSPITNRIVWDVVRSAMREWYEHTYTVRVLLAPVVTTAAVWTGVLFTRLIATPARLTLVDGERLVWPPWPVSLGFLMPVVMFMSLVPFLSGYISPNRIRLEGSTTFWVSLTYVAAATSAWGDMVLWHSTGVQPYSLSYIWWNHAVAVLNCLTLPQMAQNNARNYAASKSWWSSDQRPACPPAPEG